MAGAHPGLKYCQSHSLTTAFLFPSYAPPGDLPGTVKTVRGASLAAPETIYFMSVLSGLESCLPCSLLSVFCPQRATQSHIVWEGGTECPQSRTLTHSQLQVSQALDHACSVDRRRSIILPGEASPGPWARVKIRTP